MGVLQAADRPTSCIIFVRSESHVAFPERLHQLRHNCIHTGLDPQQTRERLRIVLQQANAGTHLYVCGPKALIDLVSTLASEAGWSDSQVHFELSSPTLSAMTRTNPSGYACNTAARNSTVPAGVSLADSLKARGITLDTSCEQGGAGPVAPRWWTASRSTETFT